MYLNTSIFKDEYLDIPEDTRIIFVSDYFLNEYSGGAELTSEALINSSPVKVFKLKSSLISMEVLRKNASKFWIFGNFSQLNVQLIPTIIGNLKYSILEYDYKYCIYRSPEKHMADTKSPCTCHNSDHGKLISAFYYNSAQMWWMSEKQKERYTTFFPFLLEKNTIVLSSVFDDTTLGLIKKLSSNEHTNPWIVLGSNSWVKGFEAAKEKCEKDNLDYEVVWNLKYEDLLEKLSKSKGLVYTPSGADTCPRLVIEAKLLGCQLILNDNVQNRYEEWFNTENVEETYDYLYANKTLFWRVILSHMNYQPTISGYTTTYNCVKQDYPFLECISSMINFCDEICVADGNSNDGTLEELAKLAYNEKILYEDLLELVAKKNEAFVSGAERYYFPNELSSGLKKKENFKVVVNNRNWDDTRFAVFDGQQKAESRNLATGEFCWQMDSDEVVHEEDYEKITNLVKNIPKFVNIVCLPVIEYWGGKDKVRLDVTPWKWRLSKNHPNITHGIPAELRKIDSNGKLYSAQGTDGCDLIDKTNGKRLDHVNFMTPQMEELRRHAMNGDLFAIKQYENLINDVIKSLPPVYHFSWWNLNRKINTYKNYWGKHWKSLYDIEVEDTPENNMMFDKRWQDVTDTDISNAATLMKEKLGGWIWHKKWNRSVTTPHMTINKDLPKVIVDWCKNNE